MKYYLLSVMQPVGGPPAPEVLEEIGKNLDVFHQELREADAWVFAGGLHGPESSTVLRPRDGDVLITDGPYAEGKEMLGGTTTACWCRCRSRTAPAGTAT
ncbi:hypothetical protein [Streptomyces vastus]|uniref:YCII-related domain-containing protein n=1 Tax=Streptomyces vastus TaxID=285451 RepID=A0ABN3QNB2_9ACTN